MRNAIYAALLLAAPAAAQPVTQPKACQVTIARAPDDVRAVVETWVKTEPRCSVALEIRIVPTEGGLYLLAQDERGRFRERIVPDAQTAGVLVASWIADDNAPAPAPPPAAAPSISPPAEPAVPRAPVAELRGESLAPPGLAPVTITATGAAPARRSKWIAASGMVPLGEGSGFGLRLDVDVLRRGKWLVGAGVSGSDSVMRLASASGDGNMDVQDYKAIAYVARSSMFGRWELRPTLGAGIVYTEGTAWDPTMSYSLAGVFPTLEGSFMLSRELGSSWSAYGGPLATLISQQFEVQSAYETYPRTLQRGNLDLVLLAGVRHRL